ncbi:MAG: hypothetical protein C0597_07790 [Marinilabiliales bacterium]|nr:MAG: hypothetical protein C0597_07790 [Marinilabiliales bacterium]
MIYRKLIIYYFSGTGNARNVAFWIDQLAKEFDIKSKIIDISKLKDRKKLEIPKDALIGFCSPTHGFNFPPIMFHFLLRFPPAKKNDCFIVNTRAGMKAGRFFLPGISGMAQYFSALILRLKGYKIKGMHPIDLPSNWISFHPGIKEKVVKSIYERRKSEVTKLAHNLFSGGKSYKGLRAIIVDILITPIAFAYYIVGRFILAKSFYASQDCSKCNLCIQKCPIQAIKTIDKRPFWTHNCESCMQCMNICPERAIETAHGLTIGMYYLITSVVIIKLYQLVDLNIIIDKLFPEWLGDLFQFFIDAGLIIILFIVYYSIFHYLLRFKIFERFVVYTSLTKWKFWRRYKIIKK